MGTIIDSSANKRKKNVSFSTAEYSYYPYAVGDHPDCRTGPPISIGWTPFGTETKNIESFEFDKPSSNLNDLYLRDSVRMKILLDAGMPLWAITDAQKWAREAARKRRTTKNSLNTTPVVEEIMKIVKKKKIRIRNVCSFMFDR